MLTLIKELDLYKLTKIKEQLFYTCPIVIEEIKKQELNFIKYLMLLILLLTINTSRGSFINGLVGLPFLSSLRNRI